MQNDTLIKTDSIFSPPVVLDFGSLVADLELLSDGPSIDLRFAFDGAMIVVTSRDKIISSRSSTKGWMAVPEFARARILLHWIHEAATEYRRLEEKRLFQAARKKRKRNWQDSPKF